MALQQWRRAVSLAATLALVLLTAPLTGALSRDCQICPPTCPMHAAHGERAPDHGHETVAKKPTCHGVPASPHGAAASTDRHGLRLTRPPCGNHSAVAGVVVAPMILPAALPWRVAQRVAPAPLEARRMRERLSEPPDTPPPILAA